MIFTDINEVHRAYETGAASLHASCRVRMKLSEFNDAGEIVEHVDVVRTTVGRALLSALLPRGLPFGREQQNRSERAEWAGMEDLGALKWKAGDILLGKFNGERLGFMDDKPMVTVASARSGKSSTVIVPTLLT